MTEEEDWITLWKETTDELAKNGKTWLDVRFVFCRGRRLAKETFARFAKNFKYRPWMYGANSIELSLILYGKDFVMTRYEYDGSERWVLTATVPPSSYVWETDAKRILQRY